jgi:hypothetical protein
MKTLHFKKKSDAAGLLDLKVSVGSAETECEIVVTVEPSVAPKNWLPGFWKRLEQGWRGESLQRPEQGSHDVREPLS